MYLYTCRVCYVTYIHIVSGQVENLMADIMRAGSSFTITITWSAPIEPNGVITHYIYTITDNSNNSVVVNDTTNETSVVDLNVMDIDPHTDYTVSVLAVNFAGNGESTQISVLSPQTGKRFHSFSKCRYILSLLLLSLSAEPGPVGNLEASFNTDLDFNRITRIITLDMGITWDEPTNKNGIIRSYEVTVHQTDNSSVIVYTNTTLVTSVTPSVMVLPFTNYTVTVAASTSAGQGESSSVTELSPQAGNIKINSQLLHV